MDSLEGLSREELILRLKRYQAQPKLGLLWERDEIEHEKALDDDFIVCDLDAELSHGPAPYEHLLIEGDNFESLRYLRMTHAGRVKCIYIDPPYNTGGRGFVYNNRYINQDDRYRHSTWLEFMYRRLVLARDLLVRLQLNVAMTAYHLLATTRGAEEERNAVTIRPPASPEPERASTAAAQARRPLALGADPPAVPGHR